MTKLKRILYSIRNLWYWKPRYITKKECIHLRELSIDDPRRAATELLLISVGLRLVDEDSGGLNGVYFTTIQKETIALAAGKGYYTGFR